MTLTKYKDYQELFNKCVFWFTGYSPKDDLAFPIYTTKPAYGSTFAFTPFYDTGKSKTLLTFNGAEGNSYISAGSGQYLMGSSNFTIAFWARFTYIPASGVSFVIWNGTDTEFYAVQISSGGRIVFNGYATSAYIWNLVTDNGSIVINTWVHVTCVRNGNYQAIYINAAQNGTTGSGSGALGTHSTPFYISECSYVYGNPNRISGNLKDMLIYKDRALTVPEMKMLMILTHPLTGIDPYPLIDGSRGVE